MHEYGTNQVITISKEIRRALAAEYGCKGGKSRSKAKIAAAQANGRKRRKKA